MQEPNVQIFIKEQILGEGIVKTILIDQGNLVTGGIVVCLLLIVMVAFKVLLRSKTLVDKMKKKLMWSSVLRGQI